jgi:hypothetical protein
MQHNAELKRQQEAKHKRPENILKKQWMERKDNADPIYIALDEIGRAHV